MLESLRGFYVFAHVAETQSFSRAADRLGITKSAVSKQVAQLEQELGVQLIVRTTRKLALTEDEPTIKPYEEARWAELIDGRTGPAETSLALLELVHDRWVMLLRSLTPEQLARRFRHPEHSGLLNLDWLLAMYSWHGKHHVAHITSLRERERWHWCPPPLGRQGLRQCGGCARPMPTGRDRQRGMSSTRPPVAT